MQLHIERPLSVRKVLVPKLHPIDLVSHTVYEWSTIYAISSQNFLFFILKKITSLFVKNLHFLYVLLDNFLKNQKFKNPAADCVDNGLLTLCAEKNWNPLKIRYQNLAYA